MLFNIQETNHNPDKTVHQLLADRTPSTHLLRPQPVRHQTAPEVAS